MVNDLGTVKSVLPPSVQSSPTAATGPRGLDPAAETRQAEKAPPAEQAQKSEEIDDVVSDLNDLVRNLQRELRFSVDDNSGDTVIKVIDKETDEVLRQIPSDEILALRKRLEDVAGVFFQDSA